MISELLHDHPTVIGMVHLDALPGAPGFEGELSAVVRKAAEDASVIAAAGFDGIMVENFGDSPFFKDDLPPETVAALTRCALAVKEAAPALPLGINALRNDGLAALGIAVAVGATFIRINVLTGAMVTDQGVIEGRAAEILRRRAMLGKRVGILADIAVKHAAPLAPLDLEQCARDTAGRGGADGLIVTGSGTGRPTDPSLLRQVRGAVPGTPVFVGSGVTTRSLVALGADGYIVGTALKLDGRVNLERCRAIRQAALSAAR